jgi:hypothetical protein
LAFRSEATVTPNFLAIEYRVSPGLMTSFIAEVAPFQTAILEGLRSRSSGEKREVVDLKGIISCAPAVTEKG